jgi:hypothetical protein
MKKIVLLIFLNSMFAFSQEKQNDLNEYFLKGKVKKFHSVKYNVLIINDSIFIKGDKIDKNRRFYSVNNHYLDSNLNSVRKVISRYNFNNRLRKELWYNSDNQLNYKIIYKYQRGILVKIFEKDFDEKYCYLSKYSHDANGFINKIEEFENDSLTNLRVFENDSAGRTLKFTMYGADRQINEIIANQYDKFGNQTKQEKSNNSNTLISKIIYSYDTENKLIEQNQFLEDRTIYRQYNRMGEEILSVNETSIDSILVNEYSYDENNNWILKTTYFDGIPIYIEEREVTYY